MTGMTSTTTIMTVIKVEMVYSFLPFNGGRLSNEYNAACRKKKELRLFFK